MAESLIATVLFGAFSIGWAVWLFVYTGRLHREPE